MKPLDRCHLYAFIDTGYLLGRKPASIAKALCEGGADIIQVRAKGLPPEAFRRLIREVQPVLEAADVGLVVNDSLSLAKEEGAMACHLGQEDFFGTGWRHRIDCLPGEADLLLGLSTHRPNQAKRAMAAGADYLAVGPVYRTGTKPLAEPVTLEYVQWAAAHVPMPWFAIGGIHLGNLEEVVAAGARRICVVSAILQARDVAETCHEFKDRLLCALKLHS